MNTSPTSPSPEPTDSTAELKSAAKWLVAASGSIAALLVAGVQLKDARLVGGPVAVAALACAGLAIGAVGVILWTAIAVLAAPRHSLARLAELDHEDGGAFPGPRLDEPRTPLIQHIIVERRLELLGPDRDAIDQLATDRSASYRAMFGGQKVRIGGRDYDPAQSGDLTALQSQSFDIELRIERVLDAAEHWEVRRRFSRLTTVGAVAATAFAVGILGFVWITSTPRPSASVTQPVPVRVAAPTAPGELRSLGLRLECAGQTLRGFAVGGTLAMPVVVVEGTATCPPQRIGPSKDLVVVPVPTTSPR
ncbi:hypothetical protein BJY22_002547 [Kribbella shirazensis]|uniref:Uncharacterized protein n=1 Tax=Kribbella shirazensis TaxID=1105143 RepID=A0A7X5V8X1_9ACTN|nr:hypothetical protein [Kribbella shirazensis]